MSVREPGHLLHVPGRNNDVGMILGAHKKRAFSDLHMQAENCE